ncbi:MAG TPA: glycosyltransferase family 4 protein [Acidimicrobiales bacterium]
MRVLAVHNNYSSRVPSGENLAVRDETTWLREAGVDVLTHEAHNDDAVAGGPVAKLRQAAESVWSVSAARRLADDIERFRPDVVHVHNLFPLLSASVPWAALRRDVPVVWTVHNRRVRCVNGTNFRVGEPCEQCRPGRRLPGIRHGCYSSSSLASALVTASSSLYAGIARRRVTAIAVTEAVRRWLVDEAAFPADRVRVKYNGVPAPTAEGTPPHASRRFVFAGLLGAHKGVGLLLDAWARADLPADVELHVAGDGQLGPDVAAAAERDPRITWHRHVPAEEVHALMAGARAVVVPSRWEEPFGRVAAEALAHGRPVITTGRGGLAEIVDDASGWVTGTEPEALAAALAAAAGNDEEVARKGKEAARRHEELFSPAATTRALVDIYREIAGLD